MAPVGLSIDGMELAEFPDENLLTSWPSPWRLSRGHAPWPKKAKNLCGRDKEHQFALVIMIGRNWSRERLGQLDVR